MPRLDILIEVICNDGPQPPDHPLIVARDSAAKFMEAAMRDAGDH